MAKSKGEQREREGESERETESYISSCKVTFRMLNKQI